MRNTHEARIEAAKPQRHLMTPKSDNSIKPDRIEAANA